MFNINDHIELPWYKWNIIIVIFFTVPEPTVSVHESLVSTFTSPQRVEERLNALCTASSSLSDPEKHEQVCLFLEESCTEIFPGCKAIPFGSRVSGLALHDSDLDVFLDTGNK